MPPHPVVMSSYSPGAFSAYRLECETTAGRISYPVTRCRRNTSNRCSEARISRCHVQVKSFDAVWVSRGPHVSETTPSTPMIYVSRTDDLLQLSIFSEGRSLLILWRC